MPINLSFVFSLVATAISAAFAGIILLSILQKRAAPRVAPIFLESSGAAEYLFDGETLIDSTPTARSILPKMTDRGATPWPQLISYLEHRFPGATERLGRLQSDGKIIMSGTDDQSATLLLKAEWRGGLTRIALIDSEISTAGRGTDSLTRRAIQEELGHLRSMAALLPMPVWRETSEGDVIWANSEYLRILSDHLVGGEDLSWPLPRLFERTAAAQGERRQRQKLTRRDDAAAYWFELSGFDEAGGRLIFAFPADSVVQAEQSLRAFMQTLTKTFAHLSTGLAIFDQSRQLALFNPALVDLTGLPPDFLTARPTLVSFFDALRENSMIPEPRDYRNWRNEITDLEQAAASGLYEDTWSLPAGQTYRVTGRPHPNGALALSFEDISTEMTQTRRYRADLELGQAVINAMDEAIAVFSSAGAMVMSNASYSELWGHDPAASLGNDGTILAVCEYWRDQSTPSTIWDRAEDFVAKIGARETWTDKVRLADGRLIECRFAGLSGGATLSAFRPIETADEQDIPFTSSRKMA